MKQDVIPTLPDQARQLLQSTAGQDETSRTALLRLALACHGRMLELETTDRHAAVEHALAGADLFACLAALPGPQPEWLSVHQEQCIRYGAIWIHGLLNDPAPMPPGWCERAMQLLEELPHFHTEPLHWPAALRADLLRANLLRANPPAAAAAGPALVDLLHLHGFKCAGSTFIASLERACAGAVAYVESPVASARLPWQQLQRQWQRVPGGTVAITSHLISLPPPGRVARLKVAFLRDPIARIRSAYRFQRDVQKNLRAADLRSYVAGMERSALANYQSRHLSRQDPESWSQHRGWSLDAAGIDLQRSDLFIGLVERYDESIVLLERRLAALGCPLDLAYPQAINTSRERCEAGPAEPEPTPEQWQAATAIDADLHQRVSSQLDQQIQQQADHSERLADFRARCARLRNLGWTGAPKPYQDWILLEPDPGPTSAAPAGPN